ncbi:MAG TPA: alpha/beta fold hydrolase [Candidatus Hydrogenedentes bacterium]|nr:alpha/beta fold hydrolase [Candidatus Hydrogenedentota bacterium]
MTAVFITIAVLASAGVLIAAYLLLLPRLYPEKIRTNEVSYVRTGDLWLLRVCRYRKEARPGEPVLLVHGMGANQNNFTSPPGGCLVDYLCEKGYDCWTLDLRGSRSSIAPFKHSRDEVRMEDFFMEDLPAVIQHIQKTTSSSKVHWIGHSMGGMLLYAFVQKHGGASLASGIALGAPIDFADAAGNVPTGLVAFGGKHPRLAGNIIRGAIPLLKALRIGQSVFPVNMHNIPGTMRAAHFVNMIEDPLPGLMRQVRTWIMKKEYTLLDGSMDVSQGLSDFSAPLLAFYAAVDPFINAPRAMEFFATIKRKDKRAVVCSREQGFAEDYNHCDLAFGREAAVEIFEPVHKWLKTHPCPVPGAKRKSPAAPPEEKTADKMESPVRPAEKVAALTEQPQKAAPAKAKPKVPAKSKAKPKSTVTKTPIKPAPASKTAPKVKKTAAPVKKRVPVAKKSVTLPAKTDTADQGAASDALEINPEALARAASIRAARNQTLSEIDSLLDKGSKRSGK